MKQSENYKKDLVGPKQGNQKPDSRLKKLETQVGLKVKIFIDS